MEFFLESLRRISAWSQITCRRALQSRCKQRCGRILRALARQCEKSQLICPPQPLNSIRMQPILIFWWERT